jgi:hypothetical protein
MEERATGAGGTAAPEPARRRTFLMGAGLAGAAGVAGPLLGSTGAQAATASPSAVTRGPAGAVPAAQAYLPLPTGTPAVGDVPVVTTNGSDQTEWTGAVTSSELGRAGGVATLDGEGKVPLNELPIASTSLVLAGPGAPASSLGYNGDTYINTSTNQVYIKVRGAWIQNGVVGYGLLAATAYPGGFALRNATPTILTWTAPGDGAVHRVTVEGTLRVTAQEAGGGIDLNFTDPGGTTGVLAVYGGGAAAQAYGPTGGTRVLVAPGSTVTLVQSTALTRGAATLYAELWGS